jgi:intein-encoded DNA endonuclease-like protein
MKISDNKKKQILMLREEGLSYPKIAKETRVSRSSVMKIIKEKTDSIPKVLDAWIYKICPNPNIVLIHFGDKYKWAKCVVKAGGHHHPSKPLKVREVDTTDEELYRQF